MNKKTAATAIPTLAASPFVPVEVVDDENLSAADHEFLGKQEKVIEAGQRTFLEVGTALMNIRDYKNGLLCERYGGWEAYCRERWGIGQSQAYRLMGAAKVLKALSPMGETQDLPMPANERVARPITLLLEVPAQRKAWKKAVAKAGGGEITHNMVNQAVREEIRNGAKTTRKERKTVQVNPPARKLDAKSLKAIRGKLTAIKKAAKGNNVITGLVADIEAFLPD